MIDISAQLFSKLIDGRFPDYERVIPEISDDGRHIKVDRELLRQSLARTDAEMTTQTEATAGLESVVVDANTALTAAQTAAGVIPEPMVPTAGPTLTPAQAAKAIVSDPDDFLALKDSARPGGTEGEALTGGEALTVDGDTVTHTTDEPAFAKLEGAPAAIEGWAGSVHQRTIDADADVSPATSKVIDTVTVYTNIEAPEDAEFSTYYSQDNAGVRDALTSVDSGILTLDTTGEAALAALNELVDAPGLPSGDRQTFTIVDVEETTDVDERKLEGMFHGVPGTFECTSNSCDVTTDEDGNLETVGGSWTFTPDEAPEGSPHMVRGVIKDLEYMQFGYWLQGTEGEDGTTYEISTFASGSPVFIFSAARDEAITGTASYAGPATGMFVKKTFDVGGVATPSSSGQFTAAADLKAYFGRR